MIKFPHISFVTPRKLPRADTLPGRVVVLDVAFASRAGGASFEKVTEPFIRDLGPRLAMWVDHHDHERQAEFKSDPRFVLATKQEHGACPEMINPELVTRAGEIQTICCHTDFDGLCAAAKWIRGGTEPYEGADKDAFAVDTRLGEPSERGAVIDRALRARPRDEALRGLVVSFLAFGASDKAIFREIQRAAAELEKLEQSTREVARDYIRRGAIAFIDTRGRRQPVEKTLLLMLGQERAPVAVVADENTVSVAVRFDSGIDLLSLLNLDGGMPTRVSVSRSKLDEVMTLLDAIKVE